MKKAIQATKQNFESSCGKTPEYLAWHRLFKKEFTKFLESKGMTGIDIKKPNHFDMSGFFKDGAKDQIWYFSISDLRGFKDTMLIRTADHYKDYSGGRNQFAPLDTFERFESNFNSIMATSKKEKVSQVVNLVDAINEAQWNYIETAADYDYIK